jgi:hypothetical protein
MYPAILIQAFYSLVISDTCPVCELADTVVNLGIR